MGEAKTEACLRRLAAKKGYAIRKDRVRRPSIEHRGGYMLVDADTDHVIAGARFDLTLRSLEELLVPPAHRKWGGYYIWAGSGSS